MGCSTDLMKPYPSNFTGNWSKNNSQRTRSQRGRGDGDGFDVKNAFLIILYEVFTVHIQVYVYYNIISGVPYIIIIIWIRFFLGLNGRQAI